ncbi:MAG TPA: CvpA family protein [Oscillatoriaceae cyanobacterium]
MSPGTVDLVLFALLLFFSVKGFLTGFVRAAVSLVAVGGAWAAMRAWPSALAPMLHQWVDPHSGAFPLVSQLATFVVAFFVLQLLGWIVAGLVNRLGLGFLDRLAGLALGIVTGLLVGCVPILVIEAVPPLAQWAPAKQLVAQSIFLSQDARILHALEGRPAAR